MTIRLFKDNERYRDDVFVSVNGRTFQIKRGVEVQVPPLRPGGAGQQHEPGHGGRGHGGQAGSGLQAIIMTAGAAAARAAALCLGKPPGGCAESRPLHALGVHAHTGMGPKVSKGDRKALWSRPQAQTLRRSKQV